jgi:photosystem II stability/assembly factor-like uncharacterized protein
MTVTGIGLDFGRKAVVVFGLKEVVCVGGGMMVFLLYLAGRTWGRKQPAELLLAVSIAAEHAALVIGS